MGWGRRWQERARGRGKSPRSYTWDMRRLRKDSSEANISSARQDCGAGGNPAPHPRPWKPACVSHGDPCWFPWLPFSNSRQTSVARISSKLGTDLAPASVSSTQMYPLDWRALREAQPPRGDVHRPGAKCWALGDRAESSRRPFPCWKPDGPSRAPALRSPVPLSPLTAHPPPPKAD